MTKYQTRSIGPVSVNISLWEWFSFLFFYFLLEYSCFPMLCSFLLYSKVNQLYVGVVFCVTNWRSASLSKYLEGRHAFSLITPTHKPSQNNKLCPIIIFLTLFFPFLLARLGKELSAFPFSVSWLTHDSPIHCNLTTAPTIPCGLTQQSRVIWIQTLARSFNWCVILDKLLKSLGISFLLYKKGWHQCCSVMVKFSNQFSCSVMSGSL